MDEMNKCSTEVSRPEFEVILERFRDELQKLDENSGIITEKVCQLRDFREPKPECKEVEGNRGGVIGELEACIRVLSDYNYRLRDTKEALIKFV